MKTKKIKASGKIELTAYDMNNNDRIEIINTSDDPLIIVVPKHITLVHKPTKALGHGK